MLNILLIVFTFLTTFNPTLSAPTEAKRFSLSTRQAGLAWGPISAGNLKLYLTNPHAGYAGPKFPSAEHVNFHVDKKNAGPRGTYSEVVNLHIVKYSNAGSDNSCLYAWDSVTGKTVFDECLDSDEFQQVIQKGVQAIKGFVDTLLRNANFLASIAVGIALGVALTAVLASAAVVAV
ncbi:MAG: hypothetical protein Q9182_001777 [Xanthomendoza sp. 2 TL-2023]